MTASVVMVRKDEGEVLNVLGAGVRFICRGEDTGKAWSLMENEVPENAGPPPHQHPWAEAYYILEGEIEFLLGDRCERVGAGDFLYAPANTVHAFHGVSKTPARMLVFDAPAHAETFFKEVARDVQEMPRDLPKVPEIGQRHGIHFLKP